MMMTKCVEMMTKCLLKKWQKMFKKDDKMGRKDDKMCRKDDKNVLLKNDFWLYIPKGGRTKCSLQMYSSCIKTYAVSKKQFLGNERL